MNYQKTIDNDAVLLYLKNGVHYQFNKDTNKLQYEFVDSNGRRIWRDVEESEKDTRAKA